jgi:hypothetical protein
MAISIGIGLALAVGAFASWLGLDRDRAFYPTVMMVIACIYGLFAVIGGGAALLMEATIGLGFFALAAVGFKKSLWFVVAALIGHGLFDLVHPHAIENHGVPVWWPDFCSAYDVTAGLWLALQLYRARSRAV